ncbi:hypothetical protein DPMN_021292 [Dreissena polymorpha]|uniref:Uncharacterized protein n=1 Tax=Dreissena polymorpha TaxID=45954 RepID=A0A9D4SBN7_DREPO|nr:hypothetical protein DPMN_021292 [Dreissena polymorpha]
MSQCYFRVDRMFINITDNVTGHAVGPQLYHSDGQLVFTPKGVRTSGPRRRGQWTHKKDWQSGF